MNEELQKIYKEDYDVIGNPQEYKGLKIYPIKVADVDQIALFYKLFTIPKDAIPDKAIRKMSYLKYLYLFYGRYEIESVDRIEKDIINHLSYLLKKEDIKIYCLSNNPKDPKDMSDFSMVIHIDNYQLNEEDFENIREIVLEQNGLSIEYINEFMPDLEEKLQWMQRESPLTFRDQFFTIASMMSKSPVEIKDFTLFQMLDIFDRKVTEKNYDIYEPLIKSGQITMKGEKLQSYLFHKKKKGRYDSIFMSPEEFQKIESELTDNSTIK